MPAPCWRRSRSNKETARGPRIGLARCASPGRRGEDLGGAGKWCARAGRAPGTFSLETCGRSRGGKRSRDKALFVELGIIACGVEIIATLHNAGDVNK